MNDTTLIMSLLSMKNACGADLESKIDESIVGGDGWMQKKVTWDSSKDEGIAMDCVLTSPSGNLNIESSRTLNETNRLDDIGGFFCMSRKAGSHIQLS